MSNLTTKISYILLIFQTLNIFLRHFLLELDSTRYFLSHTAKYLSLGSLRMAELRQSYVISSSPHTHIPTPRCEASHVTTLKLTEGAQQLSTLAKVDRERSNEWI